MESDRTTNGSRRKSGGESRSSSFALADKAPRLLRESGDAARVVVTGMGWVTPLGLTWRRCGKTLAGNLDRLYQPVLMPAVFRRRIAAEVRNWDLRDVGEDPHRWQAFRTAYHFAIGAAKKAVADSGLDLSRIDPTRFGVYLGSGGRTAGFRPIYPG